MIAFARLPTVSLQIAELNAAANEDLGETFSVLELALKKAGIKSENFPKGEAKPATAEAAAGED